LSGQLTTNLPFLEVAFRGGYNPATNLFRKPVPEGRKNPEPARECRERKPKKTKSPLGDATTNLQVRLNSNLKSMGFRQQIASAQ
jgi:hypothetical protein